jgi:hypothetical protein
MVEDKRKEKVWKYNFLKAFLIENNLIEKFITEYNKSSQNKWRNHRLYDKNINLCNYINTMLNERLKYPDGDVISFDDFFNFAFQWMNTKDGFYYWNDIKLKFIKQLYFFK